MLILSRIFPGSDFGGLETDEVVRREIILDIFLLRSMGALRTLLGFQTWVVDPSGFGSIEVLNAQ